MLCLLKHGVFKGKQHKRKALNPALSQGWLADGNKLPLAFHDRSRKQHPLGWFCTTRGFMMIRYVTRSESHFDLLHGYRIRVKRCRISVRLIANIKLAQCNRNSITHSLHISSCYKCFLPDKSLRLERERRYHVHCALQKSPARNIWIDSVGIHITRCACLINGSSDHCTTWSKQRQCVVMP